MKIDLINKDFLDFKSNLLILPVFEDNNYNELEEVDSKLNKRISELKKEKEFECKLNQTYLIETLGNLNYKRILLIGIGKEQELTLEKIRQVYGTSSKIANSLKLTNYSTILIKTKFKSEEVLQSIIEGANLGSYKFIKFKSDKNIKQLDNLQILTKENNKEFNKSIKLSTIISDSVILARDLINSPSSLKTPVQMGDIIKKVAKESNLKCTIFNKSQIEKLKLNSLTTVSKGSPQPPIFVILEHKSSKKDKTIVLVGKGVTFDSGGINVKPWDGMKDMKRDMSGAAAVIGILRIISLLKLNLNVIGLLPITENMPGGNAMKPGDVIKSYSGKTIEVLHTDAEGRLILADSLSFGEKNFKPDKIIDIATLTGACPIALGNLSAGLMSNNKELTKQIQKASEESGEKVWELPLYEEYKKDIESNVADLKNIGDPRSYAGTITAGLFLKEFIEKTPWVHLDIAGTAWSEENKNYLSQGGTGYGIRLLTKFLINQQ